SGRGRGRRGARAAVAGRSGGETGLGRAAAGPEPESSQVGELASGGVGPSLAGPRRPQDRVPLRSAKSSFIGSLGSFGVEYKDPLDQEVAETFPASDAIVHSEGDAEQHGPVRSAVEGVARRAHSMLMQVRPSAVHVGMKGDEFDLDHGSVVIAAITSCTNTSNPSVMIGAGLLAKNAVARGLKRKPWVKSSLAPGSKVVTDYYDASGLTPA